jgi:hypothetical protein
MNKNSPAIPEQEEGKEVNLEEKLSAKDESEAKIFYNEAKKRLLDPASWHELAGTLSANFSPRDNKLTEGSFIQIDLPAPGNPAGSGHDWVVVEKLTEDSEADAEESIALTLKPAQNPDTPEEVTAHFFNENSTSTFILKRKADKVIASYHGRNEKPNTENVSLTDKIRNTLVALGALAGFSELQWQALLKGLLGIS